MAQGDWHDLNGYRFMETLHGPNVERTCGKCGGMAYATPDYPDPRCPTCLAAQHPVPAARRGVPDTIGHGGVPWGARREVPVRRPAPHPAPEVPCRLAESSDMGRRALALQRAAQASGWRVQATYARGWGMHSRTGKPTSLQDSVAVRCWGPDGRRVVMCWTCVRSSWTQSLGILWGSGHPLKNVDCDVAISWIRDTVVLADRETSKGENVPRKEDNQEINLFEVGSGKRAYGKISWAQYTDGEVWRFDRDPDWLNVKTSGQVRDMAERFATREGYKLECRTEADSVWVRFTKLETPAPSPADGNPFAQENQPETVNA